MHQVPFTLLIRSWQQNVMSTARNGGTTAYLVTSDAFTDFVVTEAESLQQFSTQMLPQGEEELAFGGCFADQRPF